MPPVDPADRTATLAPRDATPPTGAAASPPPAPAPDGDLPVDDPERYEQVAEQGRGGLGRVVRAVDKRLGRTVAVKELLRQDDWHEARFVREALITARLEHPGIVPVHEAGRWPNGAPYYVMKLVEGRTLKELMAGGSWRERLELLPHVTAIADAVGYAHSEGVIHRDLKPSNVIVGSFGETIVIDWGLARDERRDIPEPPAELAIATGSGVSTVSGKVVGTPAYMAPEQARGEPVDERADVYAIGAVLYELFAGKAPHADETPQSALDRVIAGPPAPLAHVAPGAPTELCDIVGKAMARVPADRYANAKELAEDLRRFSTGKLVSAHTYTPWQIVGKKIKQHRGIVVVAAASAIALGAMGVESFRSVVAERDIARSERAAADTAKWETESKAKELILVQAQTSLAKDPTASLAWLKKHPLHDSDAEQVVDLIDEALAAGVARDVFRPGDWVFDAQFTRDGKTIVAGVRDGRVLVYDLATGSHQQIGKAPSPPEAFAVSPDGNFAVTGGTVGEVIAWPVHGGQPHTLVERGRMVESLAFDPSGSHILVQRGSGPDEIIGMDGTAEQVGPSSALRVAVAANDWSKRVVQIAPNQLATADGRTVVAQTDRRIPFFKLSPKGDTLVVHDGAMVWIARVGAPLEKLAPYKGELNDVTWSPDGKSVLIVGKNPDLYLVDLATRQIRELRGHTDAIYMAQFTADSGAVLTAGDDGTARLWNLADGSSIPLRGHDDDVYRARFSPDEQLAVTASLDGSIRVWPVPRKQPGVLSEGAPVQDLSLTDDSVLVRTDTTVSRWQLDKGVREPIFTIGPHDGFGIGLPSPDGSLLAVHKPGWLIEVLSKQRPPVELRGHKAAITHVEWSRDGAFLYSASFDGTLRKWDATTGKATLLVQGDVPVRGFAVAADGRVAAQVGDTAVMIHPDGTTETLGSGPAWCGTKAEFEPVRDRLILHRCDQQLVLVDGKRSVVLSTDGYAVSRIAISPDGRLIAGAIADRSVRIWDETGRAEKPLTGHKDLVMDVAFSPDGSALASASYDRTVRIWQLKTGRHRVLRGHSGPVNRVVWRNAHELVSGSQDGTLRVWQVPSTELPTAQQVAARLDAATTAQIDDHDPKHNATTL